MYTNFTFLKKEFNAIYLEAVEAEKHALTAPRYAALLCRSTLEKAMFWLYANDEDLVMPYDNHLAALLHSDTFRDTIRPSMFVELDLVRRYGNNAAHGRKVSKREALQSLKNIFRLLSWISKIYSKENPDIPPFDEHHIPRGDEKDKSKRQLERLAAENEKERKAAGKALKKQHLLAEENERLKRQLVEQQQLMTARKSEREEAYQNKEVVPELTSEHQTRKQLIDLMLQEAGWSDFIEGKDVEYEVTGMPVSTNPSGRGYVDYVLWDDNGLPLAVVEAKKTLYDASKGKHQAVLYADCLEARFGQRPIIYYSNGFDTLIWDDTFYSPRNIYGFHTREELQTLIKRRSARKDLRQFKANTEIAGRPYQLEAIQRIAENFVTSRHGRLVGKHRKALLVMATGSGKTRTAAGAVDMLTKCDWAKRILFLADRNALVSQAKNAFKEHLPHLSAIDLTKEKDDTDARLVFSTYPTILNRIDDTKNEKEKLFGIGHFDVIIIDEAHRSVYQKYQAIFDYFDALLIGLTATPKKDIDKNTYRLFEIEDDNPTFAYELNEAVEAGYLVPPKALSVPVKFPRKGVKYKDLSEKDKVHFEELFGIDGDEEVEEILDIESSKINKILFNADTVDKVLEYLMNHGLHIESGDKLGKTIIFAKNHRHAVFIEERFNINYPEYGGMFLQVIDHYNDKAQDLLERFCFDKGEEKDPQIAVSVDMLDTGVDAPRVLNLVFFKEVRSYSKFWQMIGRGTRLCPDIFGTGKDKEFFLILDICGNFEFFEEFPDGHESSSVKSLQQRLFEAQLEVVFSIQNVWEASDDDLEFAKEYTDILHTKIQALDESRFEVRKHWEMVRKYKNRDSWDNLSHSSMLDIQNHLAHLVAYTDDKDEMAKKFDLLIYRLENAVINAGPQHDKLIVNIMKIGNLLWKKRQIPAIREQEETIGWIRSEDFRHHINLRLLEKVRIELRDLIQLLREEDKEDPVYSYFEDELDESGVQEFDPVKGYTNLQSYKDRVENFIRKNRHHIVIDKLYRNIRITPEEVQKLEEFFLAEKFDLEEIEKQYHTNRSASLSVFVRSILGLDVQVAQQHFADFIRNYNLNANQIQFVQKIIEYLTRNGVLEKTMLTQPPFTDMDDRGLLGIFEDDEVSARIIELIDEINTVVG